MALRELLLKNRTPLAIVFFILIVAISFWRTHSLANVPGSPNPEQWGLHDFRDAIYYPCRAFASGENPYRSSEHMKNHPVGQLFPLYSPLTLVIHQPFSWPPHAMAQWIYFIVSIGFTLLLAWLILSLCGLRVRTSELLFLAGCLLICRPGHMNLALGQSTLQAVLFTVLALTWARSRPFWSGVFLALATFKPTFGAILFLMMLARRDYRAAFWGLGIGCAITIPLFGYFIWLEGSVNGFLSSLGEASSVFDAHEGRNPRTSFSRIDAFQLWGKLTNRTLPSGVEYGFALLVVGFTSVLLFLNGKEKEDRTCNQVDLSTCVILTTMIVAIYHHAYDWLLLALPVTWLLFSNKGKTISLGKWRWVAVVLLLVPTINFVSTNTGKAYFDTDSVAWIFIASINSLAMVSAWLILVYAYLKRQKTQSSTCS